MTGFSSKGGQSARRRGMVVVLAALAALTWSGPSARAEEDPPAGTPPEGAKQVDGRADEKPAEENAKDYTGVDVNKEDVEMKATDLGIRFTPELANAMSKQFARAMKDRYSLDDGQVDEIRPVIAKELMRVAQRTQKSGRDVIESMMTLMVENDGRIPTDKQTDFAKMMKPILPEVKDFFGRSSAQISRRMTLSQRLKFTGDMAGVTAGFAMLENRMKKWEDGKHSEFGNPFFDPSERDPNKAEKVEEPEDPNESAEHRRTRQNVERWIDFQINLDRDWEDYVKQAIEFYKLTEPQSTSARTILKDAQDRAKSIKTPAWRQGLLENRIARQMTYRTGQEFSQGPWMYRLETEYEKSLKPLKDLDAEFKGRIDALPDSKQREMALETIRKKLDEKGGKASVKS